jgi:hypothetical protein
MLTTAEWDVDLSFLVVIVSFLVPASFESVLVLLMVLSEDGTVAPGAWTRDALLPDSSFFQAISSPF